MYIVADIGGTRTRIAASRDLETLGEPVLFDTSQEYEKGIEAIVHAVRTLSAGETIETMAMSLPGVIVREKRSLFGSNLPEWDGRSIADDLEAALATRVHVENDAGLVGLGEAVYGAGAGVSIVMYMTVSTGVNAARIIDQRIDRSVFGSETGEQYVLIDAKPMQLGQLISGKAIAKKYGMKPRELGKDSPVWEELARLTAFGLYNSIVHWSPERVVLGGSMFNEIGISVERIAEHVRSINTKYPQLPEIVHSKLGEVGGLWGGLAYLKQLKS
jgi:glucokinase